MLEAGKHYVGGNVFFSKEKPGTNQFVTLINGNERIKLLGKKGSNLPEGLKSAIRFFLLAASASGKRIQLARRRQRLQALMPPEREECRPRKGRKACQGIYS